MDIDIDMSQFHGIFFEEATEGIEVMEKELLNLQPGNCDAEVINTIFRAAHSIKGSASTFGFDAISQFTHKVETILDNLRNAEIEITQDLISILLSSVDCLSNMLAVEKTGEIHDAKKIRAIATQLDTFTSKIESESQAEKQQKTPAKTDNDIDVAEGTQQATSETNWKISFFPEEKLFYTGNDPLRLIRELQTLGKINVETISEKLPDIEHMDVHNCYLGWQIQLQGNIDQQQIEEVFAWVEGDCKLDIHKQNEHRKVPDRRNNLASSGRRKSDKEQRSIRVSTDKVDEMLNLVGELVITQSILNSICKEQDLETSEKLQQCLEQLERNTRDLQEQTMSIRMLPVDNAFQRIPRIVHDLSLAQGKNVALELFGKTTELDKTILEKIGDPLVHLVRNAIDHGIESPEDRNACGKQEQGTISIKAQHEGGYIVLRISDDGKGIDPNKILNKAISNNIINENDDLSEAQILNLIFQPGFSTAEVISDVSGRGVGMDVVKQNITDLGGTVEVSSEIGIGTSFILRLPLTLAILDGQIVRVGDQTFIIPLHVITETLMFDRENTNTVAGRSELYQYRDKYIPVIRLNRLFNINTAADTATVPETDNEIKSADTNPSLLVVFDTGEKHAGILVDDVIGQQQVVIKSLEKNYNIVPGVAGATILGDGSVALILDVLNLDQDKVRSTTLLNTA
jgi:two-component system chemotaxis sensor kinase CheA